MSINRPMVLLTRPLDTSRQIQPIIESFGWDVIIDPVLKIIPSQYPFPSLSSYDALIFTSANAVRLFKEQNFSHDLPVFTVGNQTAKTANNVGFQNILNAKGSVNDLIPILHRHNKKHFLYLRGEHVSHNLQALCPTLHIDEHVIYTAQKIKDLSQSTYNIIQNGDLNAILFFSKRTAQQFKTILLNHPQKEALLNGLKQTRALCLSPPMVQYVQKIQWHDILVAQRPDRDHILALLKTL